MFEHVQYILITVHSLKILTQVNILVLLYSFEHRNGLELKGAKYKNMRSLIVHLYLIHKFPSVKSS
jgi:hypothetical protein